MKGSTLGRILSTGEYFVKTNSVDVLWRGELVMIILVTIFFNVQ